MRGHLVSSIVRAIALWGFNLPVWKASSLSKINRWTPPPPELSGIRDKYVRSLEKKCAYGGTDRETKHCANRRVHPAKLPHYRVDIDRGLHGLQGALPYNSMTWSGEGCARVILGGALFLSQFEPHHVTACIHKHRLPSTTTRVESHPQSWILRPSRKLLIEVIHALSETRSLARRRPRDRDLLRIEPCSLTNVLWVVPSFSSVPLMG